MKTTVSKLPPAARKLVKETFPTARKVLVLIVGKRMRMGTDEGVIRHVLGSEPIEVVPYEEGGGRRTNAPAYTVEFTSGTKALLIVHPGLPGFPYQITTDEQLAIAMEHACSNIA